jgi:predicted DNA-binding protein with PD1-like motif
MGDGSVREGHLFEGIVCPTLEVIIVGTTTHLRRKKHRKLRIALIEPQRAGRW